MQTSNTDLRNPFGVQDVPDPQGQDVLAFASGARALGDPGDPNAAPWGAFSSDSRTIEGTWSSRWNGGAAKDEWREGKAAIRVLGDWFYALFDWDGGAQRGLIEARRAGPAIMVGRYINLGNPQIVRPWVGTVIDRERIDGQWTQGRLDFRRSARP